MDGSETDLGRDELLALVRELRTEVRALRAENERWRRRTEELERQLAAAGKPTPRLDESYSLQAEQQREDQRRGRKRRKQQSDRRGRLPTQDKLDAAERAEIVLPDGFPIERCMLVRERPVWRIEQGRAVLVAYQLYRGPRGEQPPLPAGVLPRSEFGMEVHVTVAYLTFLVGLSFDKVCGLLKFFWNLPLSKSQAEALLTQLSRRWTGEFETLCRLLATSAVVHADETSWSLNSVWALLSEQARVLLFGVHKDAATLETLLPKALFEGVLVSDDAAVYRGFSKAQKCWAHLLRKAIRLTLLAPTKTTYRKFLDGLLALYRRACQCAQDQRLGAVGRQHKLDLLSDQLCDLIGPYHARRSPPTSDLQREFLNLIDELQRLLGDDELFTFVLHPEATGTNNEAERTLRGPALDRRTGRTSKTLCGARRRTILVSVFESLRLHLSEFTLPDVLSEIQGWLTTGVSRFTQLLAATNLPPPAASPHPASVLDQLLPVAPT
jgi:hypothetical protein